MNIINYFEYITNQENLATDKETNNLLYRFVTDNIDEQFISYLNIVNIDILRYICNDLQIRPNNQKCCRKISSVIDSFHRNLFPNHSLHSYDRTCYYREQLFRKAFMLNTPSNEYLYRLIRVSLVLQKLKTPENEKHIKGLINYCYTLAIIWLSITHPYAGNKQVPVYTRTYTKNFKSLSF